LNIVVIGMGYVGIPCAALLASMPEFRVTGMQRRSERSGRNLQQVTCWYKMHHAPDGLLKSGK